MIEGISPTKSILLEVYHLPCDIID